MNFSNILNDIVGGSGANAPSNSGSGTQFSADNVSSLTKHIPGGLAGGAVAGGLVAMLVGSKSARKTAGKAAKYGGAALLGGMAYKAYKGWQTNNANHASDAHRGSANTLYRRASEEHEQYEREALTHSNGHVPVDFQLVLLKAMVCAARADGHVDDQERRNIYLAVEQLNMSDKTKTALLDLFLKPLSINDFIHEIDTLEQKAEVYLASCLAIDLDHEAEYAYLRTLSNALGLPAGLEQSLRLQASSAVREAA